MSICLHTHTHTYIYIKFDLCCQHSQVKCSADAMNGVVIYICIYIYIYIYIYII